MQYWKTSKKDLIREFIDLHCSQQSKATLWQQLGSHREQYSVQFQNIDKSTIVIKFLDLSKIENIPLKDHEPIFIHIPGRDFVFKQEKYQFDRGKLYFHIPFEVQIQDFRKNERFTYKYQDHKEISFYSKEKSVDEDGEPAFKDSAVLVDISVTGASFVIDGGKDNVVLKKDIAIMLTNLSDQKLPRPFEAIVRYVQVYGKGMDNLYRVGVEFSDALDEIVYKSITSIVERKKTRVRGIRQDMYCGLDEVDQDKMLAKIDVQNHVLANNIRDNIEYLDRLRYMTTQMKIEFLKTVNHELLATALRMSSKELIYELLVEVTDTMQKEFLEKLSKEKPASAICKAQDDIVKFIREREGTGEYVLDPLAFITYV